MARWVFASLVVLMACTADGDGGPSAPASSVPPACAAVARAISDGDQRERALDETLAAASGSLDALSDCPAIGDLARVAAELDEVLARRSVAVLRACACDDAMDGLLAAAAGTWRSSG